MITILSPAKKLDESPYEHFGFELSQARMLNEAEVLMGVLKKKNPKEIAQLMDLSPNLAEMNFERNQEWTKEHDEKNSKPAILTFNGEAYQGLQAAEFSPSDLQYAQDHLRILSGLYGVLRPLDLMQPYRLEMGRALKTKGKKNLYDFWGDEILNTLSDDLEDSGSRVMVNLASNEYAKAAKLKNLDARVITCEFKEYKNGTYKPIMVFAKKARGLMSRFIIQNKIENPEHLKAFDLEDYVFNPRMSSEDNFVFTRN